MKARPFLSTVINIVQTVQPRRVLGMTSGREPGSRSEIKHIVLRSVAGFRKI